MFSSHNHPRDDDDETVATVATGEPRYMNRGNLEAFARHPFMYAVGGMQQSYEERIHRRHRLERRRLHVARRAAQQDQDDLDYPLLDDAKDHRYWTRMSATRIASVWQRQAAGTLLLVVGAFLVGGLVMSDIVIRGVNSPFDMKQLAQRVFHHGGHIAHRALCSTGPTAFAVNHAHRALSRRLSTNYDDQRHRQLTCESRYPCAPDPETGSIEHCTKNTLDGWWVSLTNMYYMEEYIENNIAYVLTLTECPGEDQVSSQWNSNTDSTSLSVIYDTYSIFKTAVCNCSLDDREGNVNYNTTSKYGYTMIALIHPSATMCPDTNGDMIDMVSTAQEIGYIPRIWDEGIYAEELGVNKDSFLGDPDYSNRDLIYLHALSMTNFPLVVLSEPTRMMLEPIDEVYDALLADESLRAAFVEDASGHIDLGLAVIKPSIADSEALHEVYKTTSFDPATGWGGSWYGGEGMKGGKTSKGILTYFYKSYLPSTANATTYNLDRCVYGNRGDSGCAQVSTDNVKVAHIDSAECGEPWKCNSDEVDANPRCRVSTVLDVYIFAHYPQATTIPTHQKFIPLPLTTFQEITHEWFRKRLDYELYKWEKPTKQTRDGTHRNDIYQGKKARG